MAMAPPSHILHGSSHHYALPLPPVFSAHLRACPPPPRLKLLARSSLATASPLDFAAQQTVPHTLSHDPSYFIITMGCQMNLADSERMAGQLEATGYKAAASPDDCSLLIVNTCSIRDRAEQKVYGTLGRQKTRKHTDPSFRIVVSGCVAQQEGDTLLRRVPEVDLVMGPQHVGRLTELLEQVEQGSQVCAIEPMYIMEDITKPRRESAVTAWVNIIYGCNEGCTYCVVPGVRGKEQSRQPEAIRQEMLALDTKK